MTAPLTDADLAAMEARAEARVRWCEWAPTRLAPPSEFCGAACSVRCDGCAVTRCAAHAVECDGSCVHAWTAIDESAADLRAALAEVRRLRAGGAAPAAMYVTESSPLPEDWDRRVMVPVVGREHYTHALDALAECERKFDATTAEVRRLRGLLRDYASACDVIDAPTATVAVETWEAAQVAHEAARDALYAEGKR